MYVSPSTTGRLSQENINANGRFAGNEGIILQASDK
jgi:hypothetical protein